MKNLITLHEAVVIVLLKKPKRRGTLGDIANEIDRRKLFENRKGNISLSEQIRLRATLKSSRYRYWFEFAEPDVLKLNLK
jgi:hypothetical protein